MTKKQRILIVHNYYQIPGGEDTVVANEKKLLEAHDHEVILYSRNNSELKTMSKLKKLLLPFTTIYNPRTARDIKRIIKEKSVEIVHVHNTLNLISPAVYYAAVKCGVPVIQTVHNFRLLCPSATFYRDGYVCEDCVSKGLFCAIKHKCYRGSIVQTIICVIATIIHRWTGIYGKINYICLTDFNREKLLQLKQIRKERIYIKPNFVDTDQKVVYEQREGFIFAGRLDKTKGVDVLLNAWKLMGTDAPRLVICGTGPMVEWCIQFIKENQLNVEMKGFVQNEEVKKLIGKCRALLLPTMCYEGFPMSIVEAYSVGTPVICSDFGNAGAVVEEGVLGFKFEAGNSAALADAVRRCSDISDSVRSMYDKKYTAEANYRELIDIYRRVHE